MTDADPRELLRQISLADLSVVAANISSMRHGPTLSTGLVQLELQYRRGELSGDWKCRRDSKGVLIEYDLPAKDFNTRDFNQLDS